MQDDEIWQTIDAERERLAELFATFDDAAWRTPSLCAAWTVREVAAHLTLAQVTVRQALPAMVRARFSFDRMMVDTARRQAELPVDSYGPLLVGMAGSRRRPPTTSSMDPLVDLLVHGQDIARPLGIVHPMPSAAAAAAVAHAWRAMGARDRRALQGLELVATDAPWRAGQGAAVEGRAADLLLLVTGRDVVLPDLGGPGAEILRTRRPTV